MQILKEAVTFFVLVLLLVVGATFLSKYSPGGSGPVAGGDFNATAPEGPTVEPAAPAEDKPVQFSATLYYNMSAVQFNIPAAERDISLGFAAPGAPLKIGDQRVSVLAGAHKLEAKAFDGPLSIMLRAAPELELFGSAESLRLDDHLFDSDEAILLQTPLLSLSTLSINDAELDHIVLRLTGGRVQLADPAFSFDFQPGHSLDIVNFKGRLEIEAATSRATLTGTATKLTAYAVKDGKSTEIRIS